MANDVILGLPTSAKLAALNQRFFSWRREVVHSYPTGNAPLTAILSMIETEVADDSVINWFEKRYQSPTALTRGTNPLTKTAPSTGDANDGTVADNTSVTTAGATHYLKVDSTKMFRAGYVIQTIDSATGNEYQLWVKAVTEGVSDPLVNGYLTVTYLRAPAAYVGTAYTAGITARGIGVAMGEAASGTGIQPLGLQLPYDVKNYSQIIRTPFEFSGTALQEGVKWDETGIYKERAKDAIIEHMTALERTILFGQRSMTTQTSLSGSGSMTVRTMSGILEFLRLWDAGATGLTIDGATYAPYAFKGASTLDTDDQKRVITNADGLLTIDRMHGWFERVSRMNTNRTNQKLILCGNGAALAFTKMFRKESQFAATTQMNVYGLTVNTIHTPFGDYHLVTHPLFNESPYYRNAALILDVWNLRYRPLANRDTKLLTNRQNNGDDFRRDEYLTEGSLEFLNPDSCMFIQNIRDYAAGA